MQLITRYFSRRLIKAHIEMTILMAAGLLILRLMSELKRIRLDYTSADAIYYVCCMLPSSLARYDSIIIGLATCLWFLQSRRTQEILIAQVAGISMSQLLLRMLPACLGIIGFFTINREWMAPRMAEHAKEERARKVSGGRAYFRDNQMWLRTSQGFLQARIGEDAHLLTDIHYYLFHGDRLSQWLVAPKVHFVKGKWTAPRAERHTLDNQAQQKTTVRDLDLPIALRPRVISWSFLKPEYLSARQIAESLARGKKYGISERISWLLLSARVLRPINLFLIMHITMTILDKAISARFIGLSTRLSLVMAGVGLEFLIYEFMCANQNPIGFQESLMIAATPPIIMLIFLNSIWINRWLVRQYRKNFLV